MAGYLNKFRVVIAEWAHGDAIALEHFHDDGNCLVFSTTLELTAQQIVEMAGEHVKSCSK